MNVFCWKSHKILVLLFGLSLLLLHGLIHIIATITFLTLVIASILDLKSIKSEFELEFLRKCSALLVLSHPFGMVSMKFHPFIMNSLTTLSIFFVNATNAQFICTRSLSMLTRPLYAEQREKTTFNTEVLNLVTHSLYKNRKHFSEIFSHSEY
jgi:hypothetical protein